MLCRGQEDWRGSSGIVVVQDSTFNLGSGCATATCFFSNKNKEFPTAFGKVKHFRNSAVGTFLSEHGL